MITFWVSYLYTWIRAASSSCQVYRNLFLMTKLESQFENIKFDIHDHFLGKLHLDQDSSQQNKKKILLISKLEFPSQKTYNLTYIINVLVSDLYTWIRMAASMIQQLPALQKFIFDDKSGIHIQKHKI